jgi:hypothetical protein
MSMKACEGRFSTETVAQLRAAFAELGWSAPETFHTYSCAACGRAGLQAKNHMGEWHPESHDAPARKRVNPSGKSGYYKR